MTEVAGCAVVLGEGPQLLWPQPATSWIVPAIGFTRSTCELPLVITNPPLDPVAKQPGLNSRACFRLSAGLDGTVAPPPANATI